jgi:predicted AlkP superfamily pyrophosphatase or phosphodiesterase
MKSPVTAGLLAGLVACAHRPQAPPAPEGDVDRVILISIDGLLPETYTAPDRHGLAVPTLRRLAREGAASAGVTSVFPAVTYPAHTTIATGLLPADHGIVTNVVFDPLAKNQRGWWWYAEDIRGTPLWDAVEAAGMRAAVINWPATVGARASVVVPEFWRAGTPDDAKLSRALSTPGLLKDVAARHSDFWSRFTPPDVADSATIDVVLHVLATHKPHLIMAHIWQVDSAQHQGGPWSEGAKAAIENVDQQLARVVAALVATPERELLVVVSDHGFSQVTRQVRPDVLLANAGLLELDDARKIKSWQAAAVPAGGSALIYVRDPADGDVAARVRTLFEEHAGRGERFVGRIFAPKDLRAMGADPRAFLAIEAAPGFSFSAGPSGVVGVEGPLIGPSGSPGQHGFAPDRDDMRASLLFWGAAVSAKGAGNKLLDSAGLIDVAPTVARALGVTLPGSKGQALNAAFAPPSAPANAH